MDNQIKIFCPENWIDYELLDTGGGEKLERFGPYVFARPYEGAVWKKTLNEKEWAKADGKFWSSKKNAQSVHARLTSRGSAAGWKMSKRHFDTKLKWPMSYRGIKFFAWPTPFRHLGFFPEQASHWDFIENTINSVKSVKVGPLRVKFLNLFGYTGIASLFALRAGAEVTQVDSSKTSLDSAKDNQRLSGLEKMSMRVICDDVLKFLEREIRRGNRYDCLVMDPPKFGRGPKGEAWKIERDLSILLERTRRVLSKHPLFVIITSYATDSSSLALGYALGEMTRDLKGTVEQGELCLREKLNGRIISLANTAVWHSGQG